MSKLIPEWATAICTNTDGEVWAFDCLIFEQQDAPGADPDEAVSTWWPHNSLIDFRAEVIGRADRKDKPQLVPCGNTSVKTNNGWFIELKKQ